MASQPCWTRILDQGGDLRLLVTAWSCQAAPLRRSTTVPARQRMSPSSRSATSCARNPRRASKIRTAQSRRPAPPARSHVASTAVTAAASSRAGRRFIRRAWWGTWLSARGAFFRTSSVAWLPPRPAAIRRASSVFAAERSPANLPDVLLERSRCEAAFFRLALASIESFEGGAELFVESLPAVAFSPGNAGAGCCRLHGMWHGSWPTTVKRWGGGCG